MIITGNTYPVREQLKALGGRWNANARGWDVPADKAEQARKIVGSTPAKAVRRFECDDCGDMVTTGTRCWETGLIH